MHLPDREALSAAAAKVGRVGHLAGAGRVRALGGKQALAWAEPMQEALG